MAELKAMVDDQLRISHGVADGEDTPEWTGCPMPTQETLDQATFDKYDFHVYADKRVGMYKFCPQNP